MTDDYRVAYVWAIVLAGVADDGLNREPWARISAFDGDPFEADDDASGRVVLYLSPMLDEFATGDEGFDELDATASTGTSSCARSAQATARASGKATRRPSGARGRGRLAQVLVHEGDGHAALADGGRDALTGP